MGQIKRLDSITIDKIAAGEVVDRPASILKELIENAIDAGATSIDIALKDGGSSEIIVKDNGKGMDADDLELATARHATSKIQTAEDLFHVSSMGFRGEALAAISSVSEFSISSRPQGSLNGARLEVFGGEKKEIETWDGPAGCTIAVRNLFFNIPARKSFLKSPATEWAQCLELVQALAIGHPHIGFRLSHNGKENFSCLCASGSTSFPEALRSRVENIFAHDFSDQLIDVSHGSKYVKMTALITPPGRDFPTAKRIFSYVNKRFIKDKLLRFAILRGYHSHLLRGRFPGAIVFVESDPSIIDVNVHPAKLELRFQYAQEVQQTIAVGIREALRGASWAGTSPVGFDQVFSEPQKQESIDFMRQINIPPRPSMATRSESIGTSAASSFKQSLVQPTYTSTLQRPTNQEESIAWSQLEFIGTFAKCYLLFQSPNQRLLVADQHAFHERILFERLSSDNKLLHQTQALLVPEEITLMPQECAALKEHAEELDRIGFKLEFISDQSCELLAQPAILNRCNPESTLRDLAAIFLEHASSQAAQERIFHDLLSTMACHAAVRSGEELDQNELKQLIAQASSVDFYHNCPHGRRVFRWWELAQVAHWFDR